MPSLSPSERTLCYFPEAIAKQTQERLPQTFTLELQDGSEGRGWSMGGRRLAGRRERAGLRASRKQWRFLENH